MGEKAGESARNVMRRLRMMDMELSAERVCMDGLFLLHRVVVLLLQIYNLQRFSVVRWNWHFLLLAGTILCCRPLLSRSTMWRRKNRKQILSWNVGKLSPAQIAGAGLVVFNASYCVVMLALQHPLRDCALWLMPLIVYFGWCMDEDAGGLSRLGLQVKTVLYSSFEGAFIAGLLPIKFLKDQHAYYDMEYCIALVLYMAYASASLQTLRFLACDFVETYVSVQAISAKEERKGDEERALKAKTASAPPSSSSSSSSSARTLAAHTKGAPPSSSSSSSSSSAASAPTSLSCRVGIWVLARARSMHHVLLLTEGTLLALLAYLIFLQAERWEVCLILFPFHALTVLLLLRVLSVNFRLLLPPPSSSSSSELPCS